MFSTFKRAVGIISVTERNNHIVIDGVPSDVLTGDIARYWSTIKVSKYIFTRVTRSSIVFNKFFAIDLLYIVRTLRKDRYSRTPNRTLHKIEDELIAKTWLKDLLMDHYDNRLDYSQLSQFKLKPLPHQRAFMEMYDDVVPRYKLNGFMLAAAPGSGKTLMGLYIAAAVKADVVIVVCPKAAIKRVWEATLDNEFVDPPAYWTSSSDTSPPAGLKYYLCHYESLWRLLELVPSLQGKRVFIDLDESHNFNDMKSERTKNFIELVKRSNAKDVLWSSGTPIKSIGKESVPFLSTIDPFFDADAAERFSKIYGKDALKANDILRNRIGLVSFKIDKQEIVKNVVEYREVKVVIPNGRDYTLDVIREEMRAFIDKRLKFYQSNMSDYQRTYDECIRYHESTLRTDREHAEFSRYTRYVKIIRTGYDAVTMKEEVMFCNEYERRSILPSLPERMRKQFLDVKTIIKYVELKVMGEALGGILGKKRAQCHVDMLAHIDFPEYIDSAEKKTVVFSSYVEVVDKLVSLLSAGGYNPLTVHGGTNKNLASIVKTFESDEDANPLVATFQSLSTAVPLIMANHLINLNSPFRAHEREQAISRLDRLGQDQVVRVWDVFLDTGAAANISTRSKDILDWSREQVESILGVSGADAEVAMEQLIIEHDAGVYDLEVGGNEFVATLESIYTQYFNEG